MNEATIPIFSLLLVKGTLLLIAAVLACRALSRASAATRHVVWSAAIGAVLVLPLLSISLPQWNLAVATPAAKSSAPVEPTRDAPQYSPPLFVSERAVSHAPAPVPSASDVPIQASAIEPEPVVSPIKKPSFAISLAAVAWGVWLMGFLVVLSQLTVGLRRIGLTGQHSRPLDHNATALADAARRQLSISRGVAVSQSTDGGLGVPVTWGAFRPRVLLPAQSAAWSEDCLRAALLHELAHVRRWDWLTQLAAHVACAVYWFHPLVWFASRRLRAESERACDDLVLLSGMPATDYAQRLVEVVRSIPDGNHARRTVAIAMAQPSEVEGRLKAVLAKGRNRKPLTLGKWLAVATALGVLLLPLAALRVVSRANGAETPQAGMTHNGHRRADRGILRFVYLRDLEYGQNGAPLVKMTIDASGAQWKYNFVNNVTGLVFHDMSYLQGEFARLLDLGAAKRPGATRFQIPTELRSVTSLNVAYLTKAQQRTALRLGQEAKAWRTLLAASPVILTDADVEPTVRVETTGGASAEPTIRTIFTADGAKKFVGFTTNHRGELMGILIDGHLVNAVPILSPNLSGETLIGGFNSSAEARALADRLNVAAPMTTAPETVSKNPPWLPTPAPVAVEPVIEPAYAANLSNGYTIAIAAVTQGKRSGSAWELYGGDWWSPSGKPIARPVVGGFSYSHTPLRGPDLPPDLFQMAIHTPGMASDNVPNSQTDRYSYFVEAVGARQPQEHTIWRFEQKNGRNEIVGAYPPGTRTCAIRCGVATGPWRTVASRPFSLTLEDVTDINAGNSSGDDVFFQLSDSPTMTYYDRQRKAHVDYFLGTEGRRLSNVARRIVAVDADGREIAVNRYPFMSENLMVGLAFEKTKDVSKLNPAIDLSRVKEFRLQTRPYETAEFHNVQLQPRGGTIGG